MSKQTAVEWFYRWINDNQEATLNEALKAFEQAKAMEREQIINAWQKNPQGFNHTGQQYYQETYGGDK